MINRKFFFFIYFIFCILLFTYLLGGFNSFFYHSRFNQRRFEEKLLPFMNNWNHQNIDGADYWFNPIEKKQGLYCWYKQQWFTYNSLDIEGDMWKYKEGDSVDVFIFHRYFNNPKTTICLVPENTTNDFDKDTSNFLEIHGQNVKDSASFQKTLDFLKKREDSLQTH